MIKENDMYIKCFSSTLAHEMIKAGFDILAEEANKKNPRFIVFCFENTEQSRQVFYQIIKNKKENEQ